MKILRNGLRGLPSITLLRALRDPWNYNFSECVRSVEGRDGVTVDEFMPGRYRVSLDGYDPLNPGGTGDTSGGGDDSIENPTDLSYADEHAETAMGGSWSGEKPLKITVSTGTAYYDTGDQKLYGYVRDFTFSADGRLQVVSTERRVEIEAPEACDAEA